MDKQTQTALDIQLQKINLELDVFYTQEPQPALTGGLCPKCKQGILDYDGLLVLRCPVCDFAEGGCFT